MHRRRRSVGDAAMVAGDVLPASDDQPHAKALSIFKECLESEALQLAESLGVPEDDQQVGPTSGQDSDSVLAMLDALARAAIRLGTELSETDRETQRREKKADKAWFALKLETARTAAKSQLQNEKVAMEHSYVVKLQQKVAEVTATLDDEDGTAKLLQEAHERVAAMTSQLDLKQAKVSTLQEGLASAQQLLQSSVSEVEEVKERAAQELYQLDARLKKTIDDHWDEATRLDGALTSLVAQAELEAVAARQRVNKAVEDAVRDKDTTIAELERAVEEAAEECKRKVRELTARMKTEREEPAIAPGSVLVQDQDMERKLGEANAEISALNKRVVALDVALAESTAACDTQRRRSEMITSEHTEELENMRRAHEIRLSELEEEAARITARAAAAEDAASVAAEETARGKLAFEEARKRDTLLAAELHARDVMEKVADAEAQMRAKLEAVAAAQLAVATARQQAEACVIAASLREAEDELKTSHTKFKVVVAAAKEKGDIKSKLMLARHEAKEHAEEFQQCKSALTNALNELEAREVELVEEHIAKTTLEATKETLSTQLNSLLDRFKALAATACAEERTKRTQLEDSTCMLQQQTKEIESLETEVACLRSRAHESQVAMTQVKDSLDGVSSKLETVQVAAAQERARLVAAALASLHQLRAHLTAQHGLRLQPTVQLASKRQSQLSAMLALTPTPLASRFQPPIPPPRVSAPAPARRCIVGQGGGTPRIDFDKSRAQSMGRPNTAIDGYDALPSRMVRAPAACACACINSGMDDDGEPFLPVLATAGFADAARNPSSALCNQWAARVLPASYHPALRRADWHSHHPVEQRAARAISLSARGMTSQSGSRAST